MEKKVYRFIISGGGTGGHLFPAIAIADELKSRLPGCEILFAGANGKMEMEKVPLAGYKIVGFNIGGLQRKKILSNLALPFKIWSSLRKSRKMLRDFKPDVVIGTGGYASFPVIYSASRKHIPSVLQEQNYFPGITNRLLSRYASKICVVDEKLAAFFPAGKIVVTGNPVRRNLSEHQVLNPDDFGNFGLTPGKFTIFVTGGSLGARSINEGILNSLDIFRENDIQLLWQTGKLYYTEMVERMGAGFEGKISVRAFVDQMPEAYSIADLVICRAGAITLSELSVLGKPAILIPSPNVAEDHQTKNALALVEKGAALLLKDQDVKAGLSGMIREKIADKALMDELKKKMSGLSRPDSTINIVDEILKLIKG